MAVSDSYSPDSSRGLTSIAGLSREDVDCDQISYAMTVDELVGHEIHAPGLVRASREPPGWLALCRASVATGSTNPHLRAELAMPPMNRLVDCRPALAAEKGVDTLVAVPDAHVH